MAAMQNSSMGSFVKLSKIVEKIMREKFLLHGENEPHAADCRKPAHSMVTGFADLDDRLLSFEPGKLYIIGGRPGMGKTTLLTQITVNIAASKGTSVYLLSLEESAEQIALRMISQIVDVDQKNIKRGILTDVEKESIAFCRSVMRKMPIYINDSSANTVYKNGRFALDEIGDGILIIDYLQLLQQNFNKASAQGRYKVISALKSLAQEKRMPVVVCSQLARDVDQRQNKRPILQDLPMAQETDGVIFLYRDSYDTEKVNEDAEIIFAKNQDGQTGTAYVKFDSRRLTFKDKCRS